MKSIQLRGIAAAVSGALLMGAAHVALADSTDDLLKMLRDKGVLSQDEFDSFNDTRDKEKTKKLEEIKAKFKDGVVFESGDKSINFTVNGRIQADYRTIGTDSYVERNTADGFDLRRAYLGVKGTFYDTYEFGIVTNFADKDDTGKDSSAQLDEAYINIKWWEAAQFKFGQFKMPFSLEEQTSSRFIDFQERSVMNALVPGKERGFMIHGEPTKGLFYGLAVSTGEGKNKASGGNTTDSDDIIGRIGVNIADFISDKSKVIHLAAAASHGRVNSGDVSGRTEGRGLTFFKLSDMAGAYNTDVDRTRYGLEGAFAFGPVKLQSEWTKASFDPNSSTASEHDIDVWYAEAMWMITGENYADSYKAGKFDRIRPKNSFVAPGAPGWGAWEVGVRYTKFDASDFSHDAKILQHKYTDEADAWSLGLKWIPNPNTRFMLNYVRTNFDQSIDGNTTAGLQSPNTDTENALTLRAQWDF